MAEEEKKLTPREQMLALAGQRYPERRFAGQVGEDGTEGTDDLEQAVLDMIAEDATAIGAYRDKSQKLSQMLAEDPQIGEFVSLWVETGDPRAALVQVFGDDLDGISTEEGRAAFQDQLASWRTRRDEEKALREERASKWQASLEALDAWGNEHGYDNIRKAETMAKLIDIAAGGLMNEYGPEEFEMVRKAQDYDNDVAQAREEGTIAGRNEKIEAQRIERTSAGNMAPALSGGRGIRMPEEKPEKPKSVWDEIQ